VILLCFVTVQGCFLKRNVSVVPQARAVSCVPQSKTDTETTEVFVINRGWRLSFVLPSEEVVEELGWMFDEVHNHPWVELSWGELDEVVSADLLPATDGGGLRSDEKFALAKGVAHQPMHTVENAEVIKVTMRKDSLQQLTLGVKRGIYQTETGASSIVYSDPQKLGTLYRGSADEWSGGDAVRWIAQRLKEGGCQVDISTTRASTVLSALK